MEEQSKHQKQNKTKTNLKKTINQEYCTQQSYHLQIKVEIFQKQTEIEKFCPVLRMCYSLKQNDTHIYERLQGQEISQQLTKEIPSKQQEYLIKKGGTESLLSNDILGYNGLCFPIKIDGMDEQIKKQVPSICCLQGIYLSNKDTQRLKVKRWENTLSTNRNKSCIGIAILRPEKNRHQCKNC